MAVKFSDECASSKHAERHRLMSIARVGGTLRWRGEGDDASDDNDDDDGWAPPCHVDVVEIAFCRSDNVAHRHASAPAKLQSGGAGSEALNTTVSSDAQQHQHQQPATCRCV